MIKIKTKKALLRIARFSGLPDLIFSYLPKVFLYHRFSETGSTNCYRVSADNFRWQLETITKKYKVLSFGECVEYFHLNGKWPKKCAVITVDDGYRDFYELAYPELQRLSLPATFFVTVNFVDKKLWLWPDRLYFIIQETSKNHLYLDILDKSYSFQLDNDHNKYSAWSDLCNLCISLPDSTKNNLIREVEAALDINVPNIPTADYAPVTWDELIEMQSNGIEIGSHTMNHPILSHVNTQVLQEEIVTSRDFLQKKLGVPIHTFCYPNGQLGDINDEVIETVRNAGYIGAPYYLDLTNWEPFLVPRMGVSNDRDDFLAKLSGLELAGLKLKKLLGRYSS